MKILVAPQSFKGSLSAWEAAQAIACGMRRVLPQAEIVLLPVADGGEGTVEALVGASGGEFRTTTVTGPLEERVTARWGVLGNRTTAVIEMAAASGLTLVPPGKRNPLTATTYGTGELVRAALEAGFRDLLIGIGGSATNDGGAGMAQALGARFLDAQGKELPRGGAALIRLSRIDLSGLDPRLEGCQVVVLSDVTNPLCGETGASAVYGPQKGASAQAVEVLEAALEHYARVIRAELKIDVGELPGGGAAGGLGAGLVVFLKARLVAGIQVVAEVLELDRHLGQVELVISGEGRLDSQTLYGKAVSGIAQRAARFQVPVVVLAGEVRGDSGVFARQGLTAALSIAPGPITLEESLKRAAALLADAAERAMRLVTLKIGRNEIEGEGP